MLDPRPLLMMENKIITKRSLEVDEEQFRVASDANNNNVKFDDNNNNNIVDKSSESKIFKVNGIAKDIETENKEEIYDYFGIKFKAPIKWVNTISISLFHLAGVCAIIYVLINYKSIPLMTVAWGKENFIRE